ncbi:EAL and modified HD-GYP domain-containing signal transduction protein [Nitrosomonas cryotolerans]|uniref:EAL and modified HD-GYP domain-containing signal transduction protein n=1 Tax=Nitrosomonas cryotolerans ATCC 49181 TaxID=1131553 RepID=A0A1N6I6T8_9PROT|nr:EAL domain-containing protein [Nitrosomonas cryotolerans]SFP91161.1 EAL and modified HD-GYP domain-containing signal transduction protein [Nitrosomonas cryotolerans]SIO27645.1 EAL and modified HD-GYP domain-containing signal transduction protein [Nitrosomonas cryotolerans ATCC 49181]
MEGVFFGKQPILDRDQNLVAYELLFRLDQAATTAHITNGLSATANVIINAYGQLGIQNVLDQQRGFINVDAELLMSDAIYFLPNNHVVLEMLETIDITEEIIQRCIELKQMGYQLALDDVVEVNDKIALLLPIVNVVKIDVLALEEAALVSIVNVLKRWPVLLLAEKIENREQANRCMELGFQMFQGYYFAKPEIVSGRRADPAKFLLLKLLTLVMGDSDIDTIEEEFKRHPGLSYNLIRMVNSAACGLPQKVNSIKQAIMILGRKQLQRWIQLLLYAADSSNGGVSNALLQTAATRGKLMELIAKIDRPYDKNHQERAFMIGILSLLDVLLGIEIQQIVNKLEISEDMSQALLYRDGRLGQVLGLIEANEKGDIAAIQVILEKLDFLSLSELSHMELEALGWTNRIGDVAN